MQLNFSCSLSLSVWHCQLKWVLCSPLLSFLPLSGALMGGGRDLSSIPSAIIPLLPLPENIGLFSTLPPPALFSYSLILCMSDPRRSEKAMKSEKTMLSTLMSAYSCVQRWAKRWTCFAKQQPGRARQKFLAT